MPPSRRPLPRRAFLTAAATAAAGLILPRAAHRGLAASAERMAQVQPQPPDPEWTFIQPRPARLDLWGRITDPGTPVHANPQPGDVIGYVRQHQVMPVLEMAEGVGKNPNNPLWYRFAIGWVYTANVQQIRPYHMPTEIHTMDTTITDERGEERPGFWAETVVPFTVARTEPSGAIAQLEDGSAVTFFYGTVFRVIAAEPDNAGYLWYKVHDDKKQADPVYALARHLRRIDPRELEPIRPGANKRIEVDLAAQRITCFEDDRPVFTTLTSSGGEGFGTPIGDHAVVYKQPSRHMYSDPEQEAFSDPNYFDLPGVPFNIFITTLGHAIHGTYWHGDFGRPRSHGCLNVTPEAARWLFRWVDPPAPYSAVATGSSSQPGTPVRVF